MFNMTGTHLPYRSRKDLARAHQLRGLTRRRTGGPAIEDTWTPLLDPNMWRRDYVAPSVNRFEELQEDMLPRSLSSNDLGYGSAFAKDSQRRAEYAREEVPFEVAADSLHQALQYAIKHCKGLRDHFEKVVDPSVSLWAPPKVIDSLWSMMLEWDGVDLAAREKTMNQQPFHDMVTYRSVVRRLRDGLEDMRVCGRPRLEYLEEAEAKLSPEVFRNTMNKLQVTVRGVEELMQSVRKDRSLMEPLLKDLAAASQLLTDVEELWHPRRRYATPKARARWEDEEDYIWPNFHGD